MFAHMPIFVKFGTSTFQIKFKHFICLLDTLISGVNRLICSVITFFTNA